MRLCARVWAATQVAPWATPAVLLAVLAVPAIGRATSCTTQAGLTVQDRNALAATGGRLAQAVAEQDVSALQSALLPAVAEQWDGIRSAAEAAAPLVKGGQIQLRSLYLLDATTLAAPADTQFFCSNASGSLTVTISMRALPPGRYAVVIADAAGATLGGQMGFILAWDAQSSSWKLGGFTARPGVLDGHDGVWWWSRARELAKADQPWSAFYAYEAARSLLVPVDFLSSPNLEKLGTEQAQIKNSPQDAFPYTLTDGPRTWKINAIHLDATLRQDDLGLSYDSTGVTDPAALRTEAVAVMSALLRAQPGLRLNFHGLWAYALKDGKLNPVLELPMAQIP
jgi:hypothetical protein